MKTTTTKTITLNGQSVQVTVEIDPREEQFVQSAINTDRIRRAGFQGLKKKGTTGNAAAARIREEKKNFANTNTF